MRRAQADESQALGLLYERLSSLQGCAMGIVRNRAIDLNRGNAAKTRPPAGGCDCDCAPSAACSPDEDPTARSERRAVRASLSQLPEARARVIVLAYFGGRSHTETAEQLALPLGTVKGRMRLGLQKLRTDIEQVGLRTGAA